MKTWILNLVGISLLGVLIEILLPKGNTNKYIKGVLSLVLVYVIISPMISLFSGNKVGNINSFVNDDIVVDTSFIDEINISSNELEENNIQRILDNEGIKNIKVNIISNTFSQNKIEFVKVCTKNMVIETESLNINTKEKITNIVSKRLKIDANRIYYE